MGLFDPTPQSLEERRQAQLAHAQQMLSIINSLGSYSESPLPQYNYGGQTQQLNTDIGKNYAATMLLAGGGIGGGNYRRGSAMQRRLNRSK